MLLCHHGHCTGELVQQDEDGRCAMSEMIEAALGSLSPLLKVVKKGDALAEKTSLGTLFKGSDINVISRETGDGLRW